VAPSQLRGQSVHLLQSSDTGSAIFSSISILLFSSHRLEGARAGPRRPPHYSDRSDQEDVAEVRQDEVRGEAPRGYGVQEEVLHRGQHQER
jgi:hypothetical protein